MSDPLSKTAGTISPAMSALSLYMTRVLASDIPAAVAEKAKHHLLDTLGAMISGAKLRPGELAIRYVRAQGGTTEASIPGSDVVTSAVNAALAGGITAHADETDDSHPEKLLAPWLRRRSRSAGHGRARETRRPRLAARGRFWLRPRRPQHNGDRLCPSLSRHASLLAQLRCPVRRRRRCGSARGPQR